MLLAIGPRPPTWRGRGRAAPGRVRPRPARGGGPDQRRQPAGGDPGAGRTRPGLGGAARGEAALTTAELQLGYTTVESPIDGLVSRHLVDRGNLVGAGEATLLTTVRTINPIHAYFEMSERLLARSSRSGAGIRSGNASDRCR